MITAQELREMHTNGYAEDAVHLYLAFNLVMLDIIHAAKEGRKCHIIEGEEYWDRSTSESSYVLDYLEDLGYRVCGDVDLDFLGEPEYSTIISWENKYD